MAVIISSVQLKGGSGKTTTCKIVATSLVNQGKKVMLIDLDGQQTSVYWWNRRCDYLMEKLKTAKSKKAIAKFMKMANLVSIGYDPLEENDDKSWAKVSEIILENYNEYDYIVIDTPGHLENVNLQKVVLAASDIVLVPSRATIEDMEQMQKMKKLLNEIKTKNDFEFKSFAFVYVFDKTENAYNDYSALNEVSDTLPLLKFAGKDLTVRLKKADLAASQKGCTAIEYGNDAECRSNFKKVGLAIINETKDN